MDTLTEAIYKAYPNVKVIRGGKDCYDKDGNNVTVEQSKIDAEIANINAEQYKKTRKVLYPDIREFADAMYWNSKGDPSKLTAYYAACEKVKTDNPKP